MPCCSGLEKCKRREERGDVTRQESPSCVFYAHVTKEKVKRKQAYVLYI